MSIFFVIWYLIKQNAYSYVEFDVDYFEGFLKVHIKYPFLGGVLFCHLSILHAAHPVFPRGHTSRRHRWDPLLHYS